MYSQHHLSLNKKSRAFFLAGVAGAFLLLAIHSLSFLFSNPVYSAHSFGAKAEEKVVAAERFHTPMEEPGRIELVLLEQLFEKENDKESKTMAGLDSGLLSNIQLRVECLVSNASCVHRCAFSPPLFLLFHSWRFDLQC